MKKSPEYDLFNLPLIPELNQLNPQLDSGLPVEIEGMSYHEEFISIEEESELIEKILGQTWLGDLKRRVQHYGWKYDYKARSLDYSMYLGMLPDWISLLSKRLVAHGMMTEEPDQVIINEYKPGQGIANHVDCEPCFGDTIISLSLASPCIMNFINLRSQQKRCVVLQPRSVVVIKGDARYCWSHGIPARLADQIDGERINRKVRISMTFRTVKLTNPDNHSLY